MQKNVAFFQKSSAIWVYFFWFNGKIFISQRKKFQKINKIRKIIASFWENFTFFSAIGIIILKEMGDLNGCY